MSDAQVKMLKRKSFFNYELDRFEEWEVKEEKITKLPKLQKSDVKHQLHQNNKQENGIPLNFENVVESEEEESENVGEDIDEEEYETLMGLHEDFDPFPKEADYDPFQKSEEFDSFPKRENKILKLLQFKNKRNTAEPKIAGECSSKNTSGGAAHLSDNSDEESNEVDPPPPSSAMIPIIKLENDDSDQEILTPAPASCKEQGSLCPKEQGSLCPKEQPISTENGTSGKGKKSSANAFAKLNSKFIGLNGSYLCTECPYETVYITHFERHMKQDHPNMPLYRCEICQFESKSKSHLQVHTMNHLGIKPFKCTVCDYASARKDYVNMHMKCHTKDHNYFCPECNYSTYRQDYLNRHITDKHLKAVF